MKITLFNDTGSSPHAGCQAVSNAHAVMLGTAGHKVIHREFVLDYRSHWTGDPETSIQSVLDDEGLIQKIEAADAVIVNGEGTIHHGSGNHLLAILGAAQTLQKQTLLVNAVFQETEGFDSVLSRLTDFTLRDQRSFQHAKDRGFRCRLVWDSSIAAQFKGAPLKDFSGKTIVTDWHGACSEDSGKTALTYLARQADTSFYLPLQNESAYLTWQRFPATLATADVVISARHHGNYFACKAGVPFVCLPSNTHKVEGFIDLLDEDVPMVSSPSELEHAYNVVSGKVDMFKRIQEKVENQMPLSVFNRLGTGADSTKTEELIRLETDVLAARAKMTKRHISPYESADSVVKQALKFSD